MKDFNNTWIKIYRGMLDWEWFSISEMVHLFIYLLLKANIEDKNWRGIEVKRGQLITSVATINNETHLSEQTIRTCLKRLISTNEITSKTTNKYTLITICNYEGYQEKKEEINKQTNEQSNNQVTNKQQTSNKQLTTTKEYKNKRIKEVVKEKEKESCDQDHSHHFLFEVVFNLFNIYFIKKASMENKADCNAINRIAEICGSEERCNVLFEYLNEEKKYFKFHVGAFANMAGEKMDEALVRIAVREQEKENNQKKLVQARVQKQEEEQREVERQARFVKAIEIGEVLTKGIEGYEKVSFPKRKAIQLEIAEQMPHEKNSEKIIKMYYSLIDLNKAE
jgi:hypothetical protein